MLLLRTGDRVGVPLEGGGWITARVQRSYWSVRGRRVVVRVEPGQGIAEHTVEVTARELVDP